jgi:hypothetical protein
MAADVLIIMLLIGAVWWWQSRPARQARHARDGEVVSLLAYDDLPPIGAFDPLPEEHAMDEYVEDGLAQLDTYLTSRDSNA